LSRPLGWLQLSDIALVTMAWIRQATGDPAGARQAMDEACRLMPDAQTPTWYHPSPAERARLLLAQGRVDQAARWVEERGLTARDEVSYLRERDQLVLARVLVARGAADRALELLGRLATLAAGQGRTGSLIQICAVRALALEATGDHDAALAELAGALALAAPEGWVRVLLDEGAPMAALLDGLAAATGKGRPVVPEVPPAYLGRSSPRCRRPTWAGCCGRCSRPGCRSAATAGGPPGSCPACRSRSATGSWRCSSCWPSASPTRRSPRSW
jgi:LuxR family maltose regulon positive regulatory protein